MKPLEAPRSWMVYSGVGIVLWLALALVDWVSGNVTWRILAYLVLAVASSLMFLRALFTIRKRAHPN
jgi:hypothetical protein